MKRLISMLTAIAVICGMMTTFAVRADETTGQINLYALYTFNEKMSGVSRTTAADRSGNGHDATLKGSVKYVADTERQSKVLYTSGLNGSYMEFPLPTDESGKVLESFTVSMDMKNLTTGYYFNFYVGDGSSNSTGRNYFGYKMAADILLSAMTTTEKKSTNGKGVQGAWAHVDFVIDNGKGTIYVNGNKADSLEGYTMSAINASVARLSFSAWAADVYAKCYYDNVAVYTKALSADEIKALPAIDDPEDNYDEVENTGKEFKITSQKGVDIQRGMIGLFFEDINYAADGGLYAEMIENRSFEARRYTDNGNTTGDVMYGWKQYPETETNTFALVLSNDGLNANNPHYVQLTVGENRERGIVNQAYDGICMEKGKKYNVSLYARNKSFEGSIYARVYGDGELCGEVKLTDSVSNEWTKYTGVITASKTLRGGEFAIIADGSGTVDMDMISCFPEDAVDDIFRKDLVEKLKDINPGFLRFPGGCIIEGYDLNNRYNWKDTLGDVSERKQNWNRWMAHTNDGLDGGYKHYSQTYGLGFYEYFLLCEYLGCKAVPVVNVGMACQYKSGEVVAVDSAAFEQYIQDALDLIEFANGDTTTTYGKIREEMGHEETFKLEIIGIGNEQWEDNNDWFKRYERFESAIHAKYPDMKLVATSGPGVQDNHYYNAWGWLREKAATNKNFAYVVDEHYYRTPDWFYSNINFYDSYPRNVKVFAGEYASRQRNWSNDPAANTWEAALSEAAYLTMVERNADVVYMASYAPLFARINYTQWSPDMIWFDDANSYGSPTYYVQKLFSNNMGDYTLESTLKDYGTETGVYSVASYDEESGDIIIKIANSNNTDQTIPIELDEAFKLNGTAEAQCIKANPALWNTIAHPETVSPTISVKDDFKNNYEYTVPASSFTVLRIGTKKYKTGLPNVNPQLLNKREAVTDKYQVMTYTTGTNTAGGSIHIAVSNDGGENFTDVNHGLGVVYAESEKGKTKALESPSVFKMDDDTYGIVAIRTEPGQDAECDIRDGYFILYKTKDFITFENKGFRCIGTKRLIDISCNVEDEAYKISWSGWSEGRDKRYSVTTTDFENFSDSQGRPYRREKIEGISGSVSSSTVGITEDMYNALINNSAKTKYNEYNVDINHANGIILPDSCETVFDASKISGNFFDYHITTDTQNILPGWSSNWGGANNEADMNANFTNKDTNGVNYFQFYGPTTSAHSAAIYTPGFAGDADWFAIDFVMSSSNVAGINLCHDTVMLDNNKKPFFGYAYAKYDDGFFPGDGERSFNADGTLRATNGGELQNLLKEVGNNKCNYTNGSTVMRIIVDNNALYDGKEAYAVTCAYSNDGGSNFDTISTRYYSGSVNGFGGIQAIAEVGNAKYWNNNTRYGDMKVYVGKESDNPPEVSPSPAASPTPEASPSPEIPPTESPAPEEWDYTISDISADSVTVTGKTGEEITVIMAAYGAEGKLIGVQLKKVTLTNASETIEMDINTEGAEMISAFIWNSLSDMKPLGEKKEKTLK